MVEIGFTSVQSDARVIFDNDFKGTTPITINTSEGKHDFTFEKEGYLTEDFLNQEFLEKNSPYAIRVSMTSEEGETEPDPDIPEDPPEEDEEGIIEWFKDLFHVETEAEREARVQEVLERAALLQAEHPYLTSVTAQKAVLIAGGIAIIGTAGALISTGVGVAAGTITALSTTAIITKGILGVAGAVASIDVLTVWLASDNIITGAGFSVRKLRESVKYKVITKEEALEEVKKIESWVNDAAQFVTDSVNLNPTLIPFRGPYLINNEKGKFDVALEKKLIESFKD